MDIARLVANQLGLPAEVELSVGPPTVNDNLLPSFGLQANGQHYKVFFVDEPVDESGELLPTEEDNAGPLAAFYNARYLHELLLYERTDDIKAGRLATVFGIEDGNKRHSIFALETVDAPQEKPRDELTLEEALKVAEELSRLHALKSFDASAETRKSIDENHGLIQGARLATIARNVHDIGRIVQSQNSFFSSPNDIERKVHAIYGGPEEFADYVDSLGKQGSGSGTVGFVHKRQNFQTVLCHGALGAANVHFDAKGNVQEISSWDNVHFGDVAEDLTHLIVTSLDAETRRRNVMRIFRQYFYLLVDRRAPRFKLNHLKESYRHHLRYIVLDNLASVLTTLESAAIDEETKVRTVRRWEAALNDAEAHHTGTAVSDDEQCFFAN